VKILLTNDDGIHAPGLAAMEAELKQIGDVDVVAPAVEQSGVGHSITFLTPLTCKQVFDAEDKHRGWAVDGSPADCVKLAVAELLDFKPDLVVSGINGGLNAGINVLYSGTVGAAIEGAFFGFNSIAVSLEYDEHADFRTAARIARGVIEDVMRQKQASPQLYNLNIPTAATKVPAEVHVVPMAVVHYGTEFIKRKDPKDRDYYWATGDLPKTPPHETDLSVIDRGMISLTPLHFDLTRHLELEQMQSWNFALNSEKEPS
jgi:5'-nucleotidase